MKLKGLARFANIHTGEDAVKFFRYSAREANWSEVEIERTVKASGYPDTDSILVLYFIKDYFY